MIFNENFCKQFLHNLKKMWYVIVIIMCIGILIVTLRTIDGAKEYNGNYYTSEVYLKIEVLDKQPEIEDETLHESNSTILKNIGDVYNFNSTKSKLNAELANNNFNEVEDNDILTMSSNGKMIVLRISSLDERKAIFIANAFSEIAVERLNKVLQYTSLGIEENASEMSTITNTTERGNGAFSTENIFIVFSSILVGFILLFAFTVLQMKLFKKK